MCDFTLHSNTSQKNWPWWQGGVCDFTLHNNTSQKNWPWWRAVSETLNYVTMHHKRIDLDEGRCVTLHYITIHHKRIDLDEGRCVTLHYINNTSQKNWPWWRAVCDFTLHNNTSQKNWHWWRAVWDLTSHNNTSQKDWPWWREVQNALYWLHECCMGLVLGRKPEHETLYFSV